MNKFEITKFRLIHSNALLFSEYLLLYFSLKFHFKIEVNSTKNNIIDYLWDKKSYLNIDN